VGGGGGVLGGGVVGGVVGVVGWGGVGLGGGGGGGWVGCGFGLIGKIGVGGLVVLKVSVVGGWWVRLNVGVGELFFSFVRE
jgi:hypothetical protein